VIKALKQVLNILWMDIDLKVFDSFFEFKIIQGSILIDIKQGKLSPESQKTSTSSHHNGVFEPLYEQGLVLRDWFR